MKRPHKTVQNIRRKVVHIRLQGVKVYLFT